MKAHLNKVFGFRSGTPWKVGVATLYYFACAFFLVVAVITPPFVPSSVKDALIFKLSSFVLFLWMISPAFFLSETSLRKKLPFFRDRQALRSLIGLMIAGLLFLYLFMLAESLHTPQYKELLSQYMFFTGATGKP